MRILGVDPGTRITGYGLVDSVGQKQTHVDNGCIIPPNKAEMPERLAFIFNELDQLISQHHVETMAVEKAFFAKNASSALKLGQCRGLALVLAHRHGIPVFEYSATEVKKSLTGMGRAEKEQIQKMIKLMLKLPEHPQSDAADALAIAMCHAQQSTWHKKVQQQIGTIQIKKGRRR